MKVWDMAQKTIEKYRCYGTKVNGTLDNTAVADNGDGTVDITVTAHGLNTGDWIRIDGTTNYDGVHQVTCPDVNSIYITADFVAETPGGTETYARYFDMPNVMKTIVNEWRPLQIRFTLSDTGADEAITVTVDHNTDSKYDYIIDDDLNLNGIVSGFIDLLNEAHFLGASDGLVFNFANTNSRTIGIEIEFEVLL